MSRGDGNIDCGATRSRSLPVGTSVTPTATPATGSRFACWSGACTGTASTCTVAMTAVRSLTASFALLSDGVTVTRGGTGLGTVTSNPTGIACGTTCSVTRTYGSSITLTAAPAVGSVFEGWTGACTGTAACTLTMDAAKAARATFVTP